MYPFSLLINVLTTFVASGLFFVFLTLSNKFESFKSDKIKHNLIKVDNSFNLVKLKNDQASDLLAYLCSGVFKNHLNLYTLVCG